MDSKDPIESAISDLQERRSSSLRKKFFHTFKNKYSNVHIVFVLTNIICIWSGALLITDSWARNINLLAEPTPKFSLEVSLRYLSVLMLGLLLLLLDDLSLKELLFGKTATSEKYPQDMNTREKFFYNFKTKFPNIATIYNLFGTLCCWAGIWGLILSIPIQPFWRSLLTIFTGFLLLYIDDLSLDEL